MERSVPSDNPKTLRHRSSPLPRYPYVSSPGPPSRDAVVPLHQRRDGGGGVVRTAPPLDLLVEPRGAGDLDPPVRRVPFPRPPGRRPCGRGRRRGRCHTPAVFAEWVVRAAGHGLDRERGRRVGETQQSFGWSGSGARGGCSGRTRRCRCAEGASPICYAGGIPSAGRCSVQAARVNANSGDGPGASVQRTPPAGRGAPGVVPRACPEREDAKVRGRLLRGACILPLRSPSLPRQRWQSSNSSR